MPRSSRRRRPGRARAGVRAVASRAPETTQRFEIGIEADAAGLEALRVELDRLVRRHGGELVRFRVKRRR
jgi:hypothetical protein